MPNNTPINLEKSPSSSDIHIWSDYIELLCLVNQDGTISAADVIDRIQEIEEITPIPDEDEIIDEPAQKNDLLEKKSSDWFRHIEYRAGVFGEFYPFRISDDKNTIFVKDLLSLQHKLYIFFLLSSNLRYVKGYIHNLTTSFEKLSKEALRSCLPRTAEIHTFGTSESRIGRYRGNLWAKINTLAEDIKVKVHIAEDKFSPNNVGDGGLDIVAWIPTGDTAGGLFCMFGQCACTEKWVTKQHSSSPQTWRSILTFVTPPSNIIFIPFCFRDSEGEWYKPQDIHETIVFDRVRLIHLLKNKYSSLERSSAYSNIETIINYRENPI